MICPKCNGSGEIKHDWLPHETCHNCNGTGYVNMTNEEYLKSCTTEMLAVAIFKAICISAEMIHCEITLENRSGTELKEAIYEWLQQPHREE